MRAVALALSVLLLACGSASPGGAVGALGQVGLPGPEGAAGEPGPVGPTGLVGFAGPRGPQGPSGALGVQLTPGDFVATPNAYGTPTFTAYAFGPYSFVVPAWQLPPQTRVTTRVVVPPGGAGKVLKVQLVVLSPAGGIIHANVYGRMLAQDEELPQATHALFNGPISVPQNQFIRLSATEPLEDNPSRAGDIAHLGFHNSGDVDLFLLGAWASFEEPEVVQ